MINALKHAFPDDRSGRIQVDYQSQGLNWTLSVSDNGIGMPKSAAKPGLGTSIIQALSAQLHGVIKVSSTNPGTAVSIAHTQLALVRNAEGAAPAGRAV